MKFMIGQFEVRLESNAIEIGSLHPTIGFWGRLQWPKNEGDKALLTVKTDKVTVTVSV